MAQFARPDSNVTQTSVTGGFIEIDEATASDADFAYGANNTAAELEVGLSNATDPVSSTGHVIRYRIAKTNAGTVDGGGSAVTVTARLMQGTSQVATDTAKTATGTWTQYAYTLSGAEADAITDYTDLRLEFVTSASGGSPANRRGGAVSWTELEVPDVGAGSPVSGSAALSATATISAAASLTAAGAASLSANATLAASGSLGISQQASLAATATLAGNGRVERGGQAALSGSATLAVAAQLSLAGAAALSATATLTATGSTGDEPTYSGPPRGTMLLLKIGR